MHIMYKYISSRLSQFSWSKLLLHLLAWSIAWALMNWVCWQYLNNSDRNQSEFNLFIAPWLAGSNVLIQFICYYWITRIIIPESLNRRWFIVIIHLLFVYISTMMGRNYMELEIGHHFIGYNERFDRYIIRYGKVSHLEVLFSLMHFFDTWIYVYSVILAPVCIKVIKEIYLAKSRSLQLELNLLRAQINPHFVFNTLNNIYSIIEEKDAYAAEVLLKFSHILRYTFYETEKDYIHLHREVESLMAYVELEKIRHDQTVDLQLTVAVDEADQTSPIAPLLLVSLVENAFKHGVNATIGSSWVHITLRATQSSLQFNVINSKPSSNPVVFAKTVVATHQVGLSNIKRRLELLYPKNHDLLITELPDTYSVQLTLTHHGKNR